MKFLRKSPTLRSASSISSPIVKDALRAKVDAVATAEAEVAEGGCELSDDMSCNGLKPQALDSLDDVGSFWHILTALAYISADPGWRVRDYRFLFVQQWQ